MTRNVEKRAAMAVAGTLMAAALALPVSARDLTVVSWGGPMQDAQNKIFFKPFEDQSGIKIQQASWDGGIGIIRAKVQGGNLDWDLVEVESDELAIGCEEGLYDKLDWSKLGGKDIYYPAAVSPCGDGTFFYNFVLGYDSGKLKNDPPKSWVDFFDLKKYPGKRALRSGPKGTLEIALMGDGVAPADVYKMLATPEGVDRAFKKLDTIKSNLIWWQTGVQPVQLLSSGEVTMTAVYNSRITMARNNEHKDVAMVWNESLFTMDSWVILHGSPNVDSATKLLDFMSDPNRQKEFPKFIPAGMTNKKTIDLVDKGLLPDLPTTPENFKNAIEINVPFWLENYDKLNDRYTKWAAE